MYTWELPTAGFEALEDHKGHLILKEDASSGICTGEPTGLLMDRAQDLVAIRRIQRRKSNADSCLPSGNCQMDSTVDMLVDSAAFRVTRNSPKVTSCLCGFVPGWRELHSGQETQDLFLMLWGWDLLVDTAMTC